MKLTALKQFIVYTLFITVFQGIAQEEPLIIQSISGLQTVKPGEIWLSHEHIIVDFIGADSIDNTLWNRDDILKETLPHLIELKKFNVAYFVDASPQNLGRDVALLKELAHRTGLTILTNTGLYGAQNNKFIPDTAKQKSANKLAEEWLIEFKEGIEDTRIKPGFIKISVDNNDSLSSMHQKLVKAAALCHLQSGLTIASHTGKAMALWPQLEILTKLGVSAKAFVWVHAQAEEDDSNFIKAAESGCWISLDGLGWEIDKHVKKLLLAKKYGFLDQILISHDAGWYDPQKREQNIQPYTPIFKKLIPLLKAKGFTSTDIMQILSINPSKAFAINIRELKAK